MTKPVSVTVSSGVAVSAKSTSKTPGDHVAVFNLAADGGANNAGLNVVSANTAFEKQTSEAAMVERRDRAPTRPPAGRNRANQFGAQIYCDTLRHLSLWVCRGFGPRTSRTECADSFPTSTRRMHSAGTGLQGAD